MEHTEVRPPELYGFVANISTGDGPLDCADAAVFAPNMDQAIQLMELLYGLGNVSPTGKGELPYCETELTLPAGTQVRTAIQAKSVADAVRLLNLMCQPREMSFSRPALKTVKPLLVAVKAEIRINSSQSAWIEILVDSTTKGNQLLKALFGEGKIATVWHKPI